MKQILVNLFFLFLKLTKGWPISNKFSGKVQVLMFHRVLSDIGTNRINNDGMEVTEEYLEFLIKFYINNGFTPIAMADLTKAINEKNKKRYVAFTFDDGYLDNYQKALPIFEKYKVPFAVYITLDFITRKQFAWWYFIEDLIRNNNEIIYLANGSEKIASIESTPKKDSFFIQLRSMIQKDTQILDVLITRYKPDLNLYYDLFLNMEQLCAFAKHPLVTIGSHSITHPSLAKISDQDSLEEITKSKLELEKILNKTVEHFSYPFGTPNDVSEREIKNVEKEGYLTALTTTYGDVYQNESSLFALPRIWTANNMREIERLKIVFGINAYNLKKSAK
ncbi:MAG: polysaccharide deacetylase family protein [Burkholderiales bacterium]|nr:polysaccharide deacetylase family protein [Bacteroidia bacterium]